LPGHPNSTSDLVASDGSTPGTDPAEQPGPDVDYAQFLPPGVDPYDRSVVLAGHIDANAVTAPDQGQAYQTGHKPYPKDNWEALPVFQRAAKNFTVRIVVVDANAGGTAIAASEQKGRQSITMSIPTLLADGVTAPNGVTFSANEGDLQGAASNDCGILNPGDSVTIETEAKVYVGLIGANTTGAVMVITTNNPPGGPGIQ
jgi:hypothetical protein